MQNALSRAAPLPPRPLWLPAWQCLAAAGATRPFAQHKREWCYSTKVCKRERMQGTEVNFLSCSKLKNGSCGAGESMGVTCVTLVRGAPHKGGPAWLGTRSSELHSLQCFIKCSVSTNHTRVIAPPTAPGAEQPPHVAAHARAGEGQWGSGKKQAYKETLRKRVENHGATFFCAADSGTCMAPPHTEHAALVYRKPNCASTFFGCFCAGHAESAEGWIWRAPPS